MNAVVKQSEQVAEVRQIANNKEPITGLALLREPFKPHQISKLPKPTKKQTDEVRSDFKKGIRCTLCGQWHHKDVQHLDYVGHAALTDRLLDCDPEWNWEPVATSADGTPLIDANGGMWINLTVCGVTRRGYGHADGKKGGDAIKEVIGDALRNAAMRFGAALDLWHKGELHPVEAVDEQPQSENSQTGRGQVGTDEKSAPMRQEQTTPTAQDFAQAREYLADATDLDDLKSRWGKLPKPIAGDATVFAAKEAIKGRLTAPPLRSASEDLMYQEEIPY